MPAATTPPSSVNRLDVYRNNAWQFFLTALERTYPVTQRRVGADFFASSPAITVSSIPRNTVTCTGSVRPSRPWLADRMAGTGYEWLGDLARLEWPCETSVAAAQRDPVGLDSLGRFDPDALPHLALVLQPSLQLVASPFPIWAYGKPTSTMTRPFLSTSRRVQNIVPSRASRTEWRCTGSKRLTIDCCSTCARECRWETPAQRPRADAETQGQLLGRLLGRLLGWAFGEGLVVQVVIQGLDEPQPIDARRSG